MTVLGLIPFIVNILVKAPTYVPIIVSASIVLIFVIWSCANIRSEVWLKTRYKNIGRPGKVTLTFDDGPNPQTTPFILDILRKNELKAYFFVIGEKVNDNPAVVRMVSEAGHFIGNHSMFHRNNFPLMSGSRIYREIRECDEAIEAATGVPKSFRLHLFRPPFGVTNPNVAAAVKQTDHVVIGWTVRSFDTSTVKDSLLPEEAEAAVDKCIKRIMRYARPGGVILLHDRLRYSPLLLEKLIPELKAKNLL